MIEVIFAFFIGLGRHSYSEISPGQLGALTLPGWSSRVGTVLLYALAPDPEHQHSQPVGPQGKQQGN